MKKVALMALIMIGGGTRIAWAHETPPPPDAGISDDALGKMGPAADGELLNRFLDSKNKRFRKGLILRMRLYGNLEHPNPALAKALRDAIEKEVAACKGTVTNQELLNLGSMLEVLGQRGGQPAIEYLEKWAGDPAISGRLKCAYPGGVAEDAQEQVRLSALLGLALSGDSHAVAYLEEMRKNPPKVKYPGSFNGMLDRAIYEGKKIQSEGIRKHYSVDRDSIRAHKENQNQ